MAALHINRRGKKIPSIRTPRPPKSDGVSMVSGQESGRKAGRIVPGTARHRQVRTASKMREDDADVSSDSL